MGKDETNPPDSKRLRLAELLRAKIAQAREFPMSASQQGLWYAYRRNPLNTSFNVFLPVRMRTTIDLHALRETMQTLVQRHACLRTTFSDKSNRSNESVLLQRVHSEAAPEFRIVPAFHMDDQALRHRLIEEAMRPFDLEKGPLLRMIVFQVSSDDWVLLAVTHHIVVDFWSLILILNEVREIYPSLQFKRPIRLKPARSNYSEFVQDQQAFLASEAGLQMQAFWKRELHNVPLILELPTDFERPASFSGNASVCPLRLDAEHFQGVMHLATRLNTTPVVVLQAAVQEFLHRYSGQTQFITGSPFSGRRHQKFEDTIGFFVNMLPIVANLDDDPTFEQLVVRVRDRMVAALEHQDYPFSAIVQDAQVARDPSRSPIFQVSCTFEKSHLREESGRASFLFPVQNQRIAFSDFEHENFYVPQQTCHHDLEFVFEQTADSLLGMLIYCRDLFQESTIQWMAMHFGTLCHQLLMQSDRPISKVDWGQLEFNSLSAVKGPSHPPSDNVLVMFQEHCRRMPHQVAVDSEDGIWTYQELQARAIALQHELCELKLPAGSYVPIVGPLGPHVLSGVLAVWMAGGVAVPIDSRHPPLAWLQLEKAIHPFAVIDANAENRLWFHDASCPILATKNLEVHGSTQRRVPLHQNAYLLFTSGSTGQPKGVVVPHASLANTIAWRQRTLMPTKQDRIWACLSHQFDAGFGLLITALSSGATLQFPSSSDRLDLTSWVSEIAEKEVSILSMVPSVLRALASQPDFVQCRSLRQCWIGGESMPIDLPRYFRSRSNARLWNLYGPTEATIECLAKDVTYHEEPFVMSLGRPIDNMQVSIVDHHQRFVPKTVPGEIAIEGPGVSQGYLHQPEATSQSFRAIPRDSNDRWYLTGDRGRLLANGEVQFLGRMDFQIKIRGFRIELEEIENVFSSHPQIAEACIVCRHAGTDHAQLAAVVVHRSADDVQEATSNLKQYAAKFLGGYKIPQAYWFVESMPRLSSGKIDRAKVGAWVEDQVYESTIQEPRNALEAYLCKAWCDMLNLSQIGIDQNFFEAGGSSLQAAMLASQLSAELQLDVPTALFFDLADIDRIAQRLAALHPDAIASRFGTASLETYASLPTSGSQVDPQAIPPLVVPLRDKGTQTPLWMVHPPGGLVACYRDLAAQMDSSRPFYALRSRGLHGQEKLPQSIEEMAADYAQSIQSIQPHGPYILGGWSLGGVIAFELARHLQSRGEIVKQLVLLDTAMPEGSNPLVPIQQEDQVGLEYGIPFTLHELSQLKPEDQLPLLWQHAKSLGVLKEEAPEALVQRVLEELRSLFHHHVELATQYTILPWDGEILIVRPRDVPFSVTSSRDRHWGKVSSKVEVRFTAGHHHSMVQMPHVKELASVLDQELSRMDGTE